jgi:predicted MFS family arabinose efflux permease
VRGFGAGIAGQEQGGIPVLKTHRWGVLGVLLFINVIAYVDRAMLLSFSPQVTAELALNNTQFGFLTGVVWVLSFAVMALFLGSLADRFSRPRIIAAGMLVWSFCTAGSGLAENFSQMVIARFLVASGEAALVPAATALLAELFEARQRGTANGVFFLGLPLGIGSAFLISGTFGAVWGWRTTFMVLGVLGMAVALALAFVTEERTPQAHARGEPFLRQLQAMLRELRTKPVIALVIGGFVLVHLVLTENSFIQLWLVRERGMDAAASARTIGLLQLVFGSLGAIGGGILGDRLAMRFRGGHPTVLALLVALCVPLMIASRLVGPGNPLLEVGLAASCFLPLSIYGSSFAIVQGGMPATMRATVVGFMMMSLNIVAIAGGSLGAGAISDLLTAIGHAAPLTAVLVGMDVIVGASAILYLMAAKLTKDRKSNLPQRFPGTREVAPNHIKQGEGR